MTLGVYRGRKTTIQQQQQHPFKYKYWITARYSTLDEKHTFASLAMFDIQYLIKERIDKRAILYPRIKCIETRHENADQLGLSEMG